MIILLIISECNNAWKDFCIIISTAECFGSPRLNFAPEASVSGLNLVPTLQKAHLPPHQGRADFRRHLVSFLWSQLKRASGGAGCCLSYLQKTTRALPW